MTLEPLLYGVQRDFNDLLRQIQEHPECWAESKPILDEMMRAASDLYADIKEAA